MFVAQELELDVAGLLDILLDVDAAVTEGLLGFGAGAFEFLRESRGVVDDAHALAAAAGDGLDDDGEADALRFLDGFALIVDGAVGAGHARHLGGGGRLAGHGLVTHLPDDFGAGADELDVGGGALLGEAGALGEEAVARVDGVDVGDLGGRDDAILAQVRILARSGPDADGLVGELHVQRLLVGLGIDRDGLDAQLPARADDAKGDFAAIGDEDLVHARKSVLS